MKRILYSYIDHPHLNPVLTATCQQMDECTCTIQSENWWILFIENIHSSKSGESLRHETQRQSWICRWKLIIWHLILVLRFCNCLILQVFEFTLLPRHYWDNLVSKQRRLKSVKGITQFQFNWDIRYLKEEKYILWTFFNNLKWETLGPSK